MAKKLYYKIGEACKLLDIQPYVLRYWETEFGALDPTKSKSGQRVYAEQDLRVIRRIKELLYDEGYTIAGAKKKLESESIRSAPGAAPEDEEPEAEEAQTESPEVPEAEPKKKAAARKKSSTAKAKSASNQPKPTPAGEAALRKGITEALRQARAIQKLLDRNA